MENPAHTFREVNLVLQLIKESQIKIKTAMSLILLNKKECIFCKVYFVGRKFFKHSYFISMFSAMNIFSEYINFYISKKHYFKYFCCFFIIVESLQCILKQILKTMENPQKLNSLTKSKVFPQTAGLSMNILHAGDKSPMQECFFKNSAGDLLPALRFLGGLYKFCNFVIVLPLM